MIFEVIPHFGYYSTRKINSNIVQNVFSYRVVKITSFRKIYFRTHSIESRIQYNHENTLNSWPFLLKLAL